MNVYHIRIYIYTYIFIRNVKTELSDRWFLFFHQVWFQNRRARTLKNRNNRMTSPPSASLPPSPFTPSLNHRAEDKSQQRGTNDVLYMSTNNQPAGHSQIKEEDMDCFYDSLSPQASGFSQRDIGYFSTPSFRSGQSRLLGSDSSPTYQTPTMHHNARNNWSITATPDSTSPESLWSPQSSVGRSFASDGQFFAFPSQPGPPPPYPHRVSVQSGYMGSVSSSPASPDSACCDMGPDNSSLSAQYSSFSGMWDMSTPEQFTNLAPLPDLSSQCLEDVLGEMQPDWWKVTGPVDPLSKKWDFY